ncbi:zinc dependent phospholipase C family protein [Hymenobacter sp. BRD67]|uniref:zinc dependent phospholipase C family protein n=1 Tax=Hymenobacter sp. BRD67 TaxID=2675877 RepID=UPI001564B86D|nr:zinc dependent phospholipase C family protein [Hymenobacter sp. BRD67]QKG51917.1 zinc dependent phospholipase C family protein [Hymenobacter sp. BRD67]
MRAVLLLALLCCASSVAAFSALTHQAVVDSCWAHNLVPVLESRYPGATPAELREARSYAYGGSLLQDLGYFPGNVAFFSNLTHYVHTGDFVGALRDEARTRNELAFALGALAHYVADGVGHPAGTNAVTNLVFPELTARLGCPITYAQAPRQHAQVEFAFDVTQVQAGYYRSEEFHEALGLRISEPVLARAFWRTYGLQLAQVLPHEKRGLAAFHFVAAELLPAAVRASEYVPPGQLSRLPTTDRLRYYERINTGHFRRRRGPRPDHLSLGMHLLVWLRPTLPRLGVAPQLAFRPLPPAAEATMQASFGQAIVRYQALLADLSAPLPNLNLDTGRLTQLGDYSLADRTNTLWIRRLANARRGNLAPAGQ